MTTEEKILGEVAKIRELLEKEASSIEVSYKFSWQHKCLACGEYHLQNTPCPHMLTYCGG